MWALMSACEELFVLLCLDSFLMPRSVLDGEPTAVLKMVPSSICQCLSISTSVDGCGLEECYS